MEKFHILGTKRFFDEKEAKKTRFLRPPLGGGTVTGEAPFFPRGCVGARFPYGF